MGIQGCVFCGQVLELEGKDKGEWGFKDVCSVDRFSSLKGRTRENGDSMQCVLWTGSRARREGHGRMGIQGCVFCGQVLELEGKDKGEWGFKAVCSVDRFSSLKGRTRENGDSRH